MTNTLPSVKHSARSRESAVGQHHQKRSVLDVGMGLLTPLLGQEFLDRHHLRDPLNKALRSVSSTASRRRGVDAAVQEDSGPRHEADPPGARYRRLFRPDPDDDQKMIVETVRQFAEEILRPAARGADDAAAYPPELIARAAELGVTAINVPEDFDGIAEQRSAVTNALVAEALAYGDMGLALPILAPAEWPPR